MSLKTFHIVFILTASAWCAWFAAWAFRASRAGEGSVWLGIAAVAGLAFLIPYLRWFLRRGRPSPAAAGKGRPVVAALLAVWLPDLARACAVCFGTGADAVTVGRAFSVGLLLLTGITMAVMAGVVIWIYRIERARPPRVGAGLPTRPREGA